MPWGWVASTKPSVPPSAARVDDIRWRPVAFCVDAVVRALFPLQTSRIRSITNTNAPATYRFLC
jgi:hypothetical protein